MESNEATALLAPPGSSGRCAREYRSTNPDVLGSSRHLEEAPMTPLHTIVAVAARHVSTDGCGIDARYEHEKAASSKGMFRLSVVLLSVIAGLAYGVAALAESRSSAAATAIRSMGQSALVAQLVPIDAAGADNSARSRSRGHVVSFQELAARQVPPLYANMSQLAVPVLADDVQPADVYASRKLILKTRDLLDAFSPVYPNATTLDGVDVDLWGLLRDLLDRGYEVIGEFQDLDHAHVQYTPEMFDAARGTVLQWRRDFDDFHRRHGSDIILGFLRSPSPDSYRHRESRLFWKTIDALPSGADAASSSLHVLGSRQTATALVYLTLSIQYDSVLGTVAHEHYHNLRKELRSMTDEYDLLGTFMFPKSCLPSIKRFKEARVILGDINDMWTAYNDYVTFNMYRSEQKDLAKEINRAWQSFRIWVEEYNFEGAIRNVTLSMQQDLRSSDDDDSSAGKLFDATLSTDGTCDLRLTNGPKVQPLSATVATQAESVVTLQEFLLQRQQNPTHNFVIGNEAGDADTIVSSIVLAYIESVRAGANKTPVVAIDKIDLQTQRPEVSFLFKLAGVSSESLLCVDDPVFFDAQNATMTLTDHNRLSGTFQDRVGWTVVEIVDHHQDEGDYADTCSGDARTIAFADDRALVASACTLVAERLFALWKGAPYPATVAILLLGVILLDSVGLSDEVGKVTDRDRNAVATLLNETAWSELSEASKGTLNLSISSPSPDPDKLFELLQDSKYDTDFWDALSVRDALRQDFKSFPCTNGFEFGVSSVLMPSHAFFSKPLLVDSILGYMKEANVTFLGIMFAFQGDRRSFRRQLALCGTSLQPVDGLAQYLTTLEGSESLELQELESSRDLKNSPAKGLWVRTFEQTNVVPSRKQIGPVLEQYFESRLRRSH